MKTLFIKSKKISNLKYFGFIVFVCLNFLSSNVYGQKWLIGTEYSLPKSIIQNGADGAAPTFNSDKMFNIRFFGNGDIQKSFEKGEKIPANTGLGVAVTRYFDFGQRKPIFGFYKIDISASINIASTVDTIKAGPLGGSGIISNSSEFGSSILKPLNSGQAINIEASAYLTNSFFCGILSGVRVRYTGANRNWLLNDTTTFQATNNLFRAGVFHEFVPFENRDFYSVYFGGGYAYNSIRGDIGENSNSAVRKIFLGSEAKTFHGVELNFGFRLKNIRADFSYPLFNGGGNNNIPGLTGGRVITTISFIGEFGLKLKE